jgi:transitional endoplasmic reticulum ATPase
LIVPPLSNADLRAIFAGKFDQNIVDAAAGLPLSKVIHATSADDIYDASSVEHIHASVAQTQWEDIGGLAATKSLVRESVEWPLTRKKEFQEFGVQPPRDILLYGPPGCGKTMIARAIATSLSSSFFAISAASVFQMYLGESERVVRELFALARQKAPAVIFIDEIDTMVGKRGQATGVSERVLSTFLNEMDGITMLTDVIVVAATNREKALDEALCRPGRFDCLIEMKPPQTESDIREVLAICTRKMPLQHRVVEEVAKIIQIGTSGAEIDNFCREAALRALNDDAEVVTLEHFREVISRVRTPSRRSA